MNKILLIASCLVAVIADMMMVWWAKKDTGHNFILVLAIVLVNVASLIWAYTMRKGIESAIAITFYALFTVAGCSFLGFIVFHESLSIINLVGIVLALIALFLIGI